MIINQNNEVKFAEDPAIESPNELFLLSKALRAVDSGIMVTDRDGRIVWVNPAFTKSIGFRADEIVGKTPSLFKSGKHDPRFYRRFWDTILCGETWRGQFVNRRRDGSLCIHSQTTTPMCRDSSGVITHFISINEERISRKQSETDSSDARSMELVVQMAAGIAHHLNNLLTVVHCNSEILLHPSSGLDSEVRSLVDQTLAASNRAAHLVRQMVGFSQSQILQLQVLNLNQVVESCLSVFRRNINGGIDYEPRYDVSLPLVLADSMMLVQVVSNIILNAIESMPAGGSLSLTTEKIILTAPDLRRRRVAIPGEFVCLTIRDTGCGIPSANLPHIFEPFFSTKEDGSHSGLGLAMVHGIIRQHHGWTEINSGLGRGTSFKIFLPAMKKPVQLGPPALIAPASSDQSPNTQQFLPLPEEALSAPFNHWGINE